MTPTSSRSVDPAAGARIVVPILQFSAVAFALAGLWLLWEPPSVFAPETAPYIGLALILAAGGDLAVAQVLRRRFLESPDGPKG